MGRGRPLKLTPEIQDRICEALRAGNTRRDSAAHAGVSHSAFAKWIQLGKQKGARAVYFAFADACEKAESQAIVRNVAIIQKAAETSWQAAAWWLERRRPNDYAKREKRDVTVRQAPRNKQDPAEFTTEELEALLAQETHKGRTNGSKSAQPGVSGKGTPAPEGGTE